MPDRSDFPLPISDASSAPPAGASVWPKVRIEPVNYIALIPGERAPTSDSIIEALSMAATGHEQFTLVDAPEPHAPAMWVGLIAGPAWHAPMVIWIEPMRELAPETIEFLHAGDCRWAVGVETLLPLDDPHVHLLELLRIVGRAFSDSPAILNVNTGAWHTREELERSLLPAEVETSPALAFIVHAISSKANADADSSAGPLFAYTDGLHTTGFAELEMHGIAADDARFAAGFLNSLAEFIIESGMPDPELPVEIGVDQFVRFVPASQAAEAAPPDAPGSAALRINHVEQPLEGERIAVCALDSLMWPADVARRIQRGEAAMFRTKAATERDARIARRTLDRFAALCAMVPAAKRRDSDNRVAAFIVKAAFAVPRGSVINDQGLVDDDNREHLWFEVTEVHNGRVRGVLLNEPTFVRLRKGDSTIIDRALVSDWQIFTPRGQFGPTQHHVAKDTLTELLNASEDASHA